MSDEPMSLPDDDSSPADPFESELVAYLDGELDPIAARKVEARLATDPAVRERATALKKTFALLDYLPKPEPTPTFTTRTLDRIPALKSGSIPVVVQSQTVPTQSKSQSTVTSSPAMDSSSVPAAFTSGALSAAPARPWLGPPASSWRLSASEESVSRHGALRPHLFPTHAARPERRNFHSPITGSSRTCRSTQSRTILNSSSDSPSQAIQRRTGDVVRRREFAAARSTPTRHRAPTIEALTRAFKALPPRDNWRLRTRQANQRSDPSRERSLRALEVYAVASAIGRVERACSPRARRGLAGRHSRPTRTTVARFTPGSTTIRLTGMSNPKRWKQYSSGRTTGQGARSVDLRPEECRGHCGQQVTVAVRYRARKKEVFEFVRAAFHPDETIGAG